MLKKQVLQAKEGMRPILEPSVNKDRAQTFPSYICSAVKIEFQSAGPKLQWETGVCEVKKDSWTGIEGNQVLSEEFLGQLLGTPSECQTFDYF